MNVQELIEMLQKEPDKAKQVLIYDPDGDCMASVGGVIYGINVELLPEGYD